MHIFTDLRDIISLGKVYESSGNAARSRSADDRMKFHEKIKYLKGLNSSSFNFFGYASKGAEDTEEVFTFNKITILACFVVFT